MIICSCNVLSETAVREAVDNLHPPRTPGRVHRHFGCKPRCGRCAISIREVIDEAVSTPEAATEPEAKVA
ncbi:MAG: (2Fe-2S)-binding protein [Rhodomicrobium sp.]